MNIIHLIAVVFKLLNETKLRSNYLLEHYESFINELMMQLSPKDKMDELNDLLKRTKNNENNNKLMITTIQQFLASKNQDFSEFRIKDIQLHLKKKSNFNKFNSKPSKNMKWRSQPLDLSESSSRQYQTRPSSKDQVAVKNTNVDRDSLDSLNQNPTINWPNSNNNNNMQTNNKNLEYFARISNSTTQQLTQALGNEQAALALSNLSSYIVNNQPTCYNCGVKGHTKYSCTAILCFFCKKTTHVSKECPDFNMLKQTCQYCNNTTHTTRFCGMPEALIAKIRCFNCHQVGHIAKNCQN